MYRVQAQGIGVHKTMTAQVTSEWLHNSHGSLFSSTSSKRGLNSAAHIENVESGSLNNIYILKTKLIKSDGRKKKGFIPNDNEWALRNLFLFFLD